MNFYSNQKFYKTQNYYEIFDGSQIHIFWIIIWNFEHKFKFLQMFENLWDSPIRAIFCEKEKEKWNAFFYHFLFIKIIQNPYTILIDFPRTVKFYAILKYYKQFWNISNYHDGVWWNVMRQVFEVQNVWLNFPLKLSHVQQNLIENIR